MSAGQSQQVSPFRPGLAEPVSAYVQTRRAAALPRQICVKEIPREQKR